MYNDKYTEHSYFIYLTGFKHTYNHIGQKDFNIKCKDNESLLIMSMDIAILENVIILVKGLIFLCMFFIFPKILCFRTVIKKHIF